MKDSSWWQMSLAIAAVTLADRQKRRRFINGLLAFIVGYCVLGTWPLDPWLSQGAWRMVIFWGFLGGLCILLMLFGLFDALAVIAEERKKAGLDHPPKEEESSQD